MTKPQHQRILEHRRTHPVLWLAAIVCALLAAGVVLGGVAVFSVYLAYRPRAPSMRVTYAHIDRLVYDQLGQLGLLMTLTVEANNGNARARATFSHADFELRFARTAVARLRANAFVVAKNSTWPLRYVVPSSPVRLDEKGMGEMDGALKAGRVGFELKGRARTSWRVGVFSAKLWTHLDCELQFVYPGGDVVGLDCASKSH